MNIILSLFLSAILLMPQTISAQADAIVFTLKLPQNMKFADGAPFQLRFTSDKPEVVKIKEEIYTTPIESLKIPIEVHAGNAVVRIQGKVCFCPKADGKECSFKRLDYELPVQVVPHGSRQIFAEIRL